MALRRILFICSRNRLRSPTAEEAFARYPGIETDSAGLAPDAATPLSVEQIAWADIIFVMEQSHKQALSKRFRPHLSGKRVIVLGIADKYAYQDPELIRRLEASVAPILK